MDSTFATNHGDATLVDGGLVGASSIREELNRALAESAAPVWVCGQGGVGKTAVVAALLQEVSQTGTAGVLWVDLAEVDADDGALREHLLLKLGLSAGLREDSDSQWQLIRTEVGRRSTVLVLDSRELWKVEALPSEILALHAWPSRVVITARNRPMQGSTSFAILDVPRLDTDGAISLIRRGAPPDVSSETVATLASFAFGSPLACTWIGGALASRSKRLLQVDQVEGAAEEGALRTIFAEITKELSSAEHEVLLILSCLPSSIAEDELAEISGLQVDRVRSAIDELRSRHLVLARARQLQGVHAAHPFVRQFVVGWSSRAQVQQKLHNWADRKLQELGGDRNWGGYPKLGELWANVGSVVKVTASENPTAFLRLWRRADYFLWSTGRRRERERLGLMAIDLARQADEREHLVHALYDSVAECRWHGSGTQADCKALLDEAEEVASATPEDAKLKAMIACYRARMYRHFDKLDEALSAGQQAVALATEHGDELVIGLCENALGNALRSRREFEMAMTHFQAAGICFANVAEMEMEAIVFRNQGRCLMRMGEKGLAIAKFESSVQLLRDLHLHVECAEVALDHAAALADLGENDEAAAEALDARELFADLGALHLIRDADELLRRVRGA
jgi:tetratricopeptide (TPR) repeat protein